MKIIQRIKNYTSISIISKIEITKHNKSECEFFIESLTKDGDLVSTHAEKLPYGEITKIISSFEAKMKKCAFLTETPIYEGCEVETLLFINPELMEKERVGFEFYGPLSDKSANVNLCAYYSFEDSGLDYRQPLTHDEIFGFFRLSNFESLSGGFKATLNECGLTYIDIEGTVNNIMFLTNQEYERQFKKEVVPEPKKRTRKTSDTPPEIKELQKALIAEVKKEPEIVIEKTDNILKRDTSTKVEKKRGRPSKKESEKEIIISEEKESLPVKRGRGRPPKSN